MAVKKTKAKVEEASSVPIVVETYVPTKNVLQSKQLWFNVLMTVIGLGAYFQTIGEPDIVPYAISVQAIGNVLLRVWFAETQLTFGVGKK